MTTKRQSFILGRSYISGECLLFVHRNPFTYNLFIATVSCQAQLFNLPKPAQNKMVKFKMLINNKMALYIMKQHVSVLF